MLGESNFSLFCLICFCIIIINLDFIVSSDGDPEAQFIYEYDRFKQPSSNSLWSMLCSCFGLFSSGISEPICKLSNKDKEEVCQAAAKSLGRTLIKKTNPNYNCTKKTISFLGANHVKLPRIKRNMYPCFIANYKGVGWFWDTILSCFSFFVCDDVITSICEFSNQQKENLCKEVAKSLKWTYNNQRENDFKCTEKTVAYLHENLQKYQKIKRKMFQCPIENNDDIIYYVSQGFFYDSTSLYIFKCASNNEVNVLLKLKYAWTQRQ